VDGPAQPGRKEQGAGHSRDQVEAVRAHAPQRVTGDPHLPLVDTPFHGLAESRAPRR
jgi:hypothetical protein